MEPNEQGDTSGGGSGGSGGNGGSGGSGGGAGSSGGGAFGSQPISGPPGAYSQQIQHSPVSARVPERVGRGAMSTGVIVLDSPNEFVLDFLQNLSRPPQIVARVVLTPGVMHQFVNSLRENVSKYTERFGPPAPLPKPPQQQPRPSIQEIYEHFKLPDELLSGSYANSVLIGHTPSEFLFDFITGFYPTASVSSRIFLSAQQVPRVMETLTAAVQTFQRRFQPRPGGPQGPPPSQQSPPDQNPPV
jgi:hypothetical protein